MIEISDYALESLAVVRLRVCIGAYPKLKAIYVIPEGRNPLPTTLARLSLCLEALAADGWLSLRDCREILERAGGAGEASLDVLEALWGEPFKTMRRYFYSERAVELLRSEEELVDFWIAPEFPATSMISVMALRRRAPIVLGGVDLLSDAQLRLVLKLLHERDWLCCSSADRRILSKASLVVLAPGVNAEGLLRYTPPGLRDAVIRAIREEPVALVAKGAWQIVDCELEFTEFRGGPVPREPHEPDYLSLVFGDLGGSVREILDELLEAGPMTFKAFYELLVAVFEDKRVARRVLERMVALELVGVHQAAVTIGRRGLSWLARGG